MGVEIGSNLSCLIMMIEECLCCLPRFCMSITEKEEIEWLVSVHQQPIKKMHRYALVRQQKRNRSHN